MTNPWLTFLASRAPLPGPAEFGKMLGVTRQRAGQILGGEVASVKTLSHWAKLLEAHGWPPARFIVERGRLMIEPALSDEDRNLLAQVAYRTPPTKEGWDVYLNDELLGRVHAPGRDQQVLALVRGST